MSDTENLGEKLKAVWDRAVQDLGKQEDGVKLKVFYDLQAHLQRKGGQSDASIAITDNGDVWEVRYSKSSFAFGEAIQVSFNKETEGLVAGSLFKIEREGIKEKATAIETGSAEAEKVLQEITALIDQALVEDTNKVKITFRFDAPAGP